MMADLTALGITGRDAAEALDRAGIIVNKNAIPFDPRSPAVASGIRLGTPALTSRNMGEPEMRQIASLIAAVLRAPGDAAVAAATRAEVERLAAAFPVTL
jgi:glycine hydroxymethyltransferase